MQRAHKLSCYFMRLWCNGSHAGLRSQCRKACQFESDQTYQFASVAQLDNVLVYEAMGWGFEFLRTHQVMEMCQSLVYRNSLENCRSRKGSVSSNLTVSARNMESNAAGMVLRPALKTGFCLIADGVRFLCSPPSFRIVTANNTANFGCLATKAILLFLPY